MNRRSLRVQSETDRSDQVKTDIKSLETSVPIASNKLTIEDVFDKENRPRTRLLCDHFLKEGRLECDAALGIIHEASQIFKREKNLIESIEQPVVIVGDLHGQFYDLMKVFELGGSLENTNYLFLGDYVDRGHFSTEIVLLLWSMKILYPKKLYLLRGNHECKHLAEHFTFKRECLVKYNREVYDAFVKSFCYLPLCALVNRQLFCVHGGISPSLETLDDLNKFQRKREPPSSGLMCDLLWADPSQDYNNESTDSQAVEYKDYFTVNLNRGCSYFYTYNAVVSFLTRNNLLCIVRAHEAQDHGFRMYKSMEKTNFPSVITVFSAPNYLDVYNNKAAIIVYENDTIRTKQFTAVPHPFWLPNFMDVFTWSLPFVAEKLVDMLVCIVKLNCDHQQDEDRREVVRAKLAALNRIASMYTKIREQSESLIELKGVAPAQLAYIGSSVINGSVEHGLEWNRQRRLSVEELKELDKQNECLPVKKE